jgi:hypothetical protein
LLALLALVYCLTSAAEWGDTQVYVSSVLDAVRTGNKAPLFEFGHLLWRPLGFLIYQVLPASLWGSPETTASFGFLLINLIAGFACALFFFKIALLVSGRIWIAFVTAAAFLCANAFLNWGQTGSAYIPGLALVSAAFWILLEAVYSRTISKSKVIAAGVCLALSALIWFPYITVSAGIAAILLFLNVSRHEFRRRLAWAALLTATTVIILALVFGFAIRIQGIHSSSEILTWVTDSSHGIHPSIVIPRFVMGFPRSFLSMERDGMMFKRYLVHDPYARVSLIELVGVSLLRLAIFYSFLGYVIFRTIANPGGRPFLLVCVFAAVPLLFFALFLFDSGPSERYLPFYPFLLLLIAFALSQIRNRYLLGLMTGLMILASVSHLWMRSFVRTRAQDKAVIAALSELKGRVNDRSIVWVPLTADPALIFAMSRPFHPLNQPKRFPVRQLILAGTDRARLWRQDFSRLSLEALNQGGTVWVSNHLLAPAPQRDWNWT